MLRSKLAWFRTKSCIMAALVIWSTFYPSSGVTALRQPKADQSLVSILSEGLAASTTGLPPKADAGPDQTVPEGSVVQLDGTSSEGRGSSFEGSTTEGALPGGTALSAALTALGESDGSGSQLLSGNISLGNGVPTPSTALVYVLDLSGSTLASGGCGGDQNGDGATDTILDCEIAAAKAINDKAAESGTAAEVSVVPFAGSSVIADVGPQTGIQIRTGPNTDAGGEPGQDVDEVLSSMDTGGFIVSIGKFRFLIMSGGTNYSAGLSQACSALSNASVPNRIAVFLSDGENLLGRHISTSIPCGQPVTFHTFAVGSAASCAGNPVNLGSLQDIADLTGGTCTEVRDVSSLPDILPKVIAATLIRLELKIDGGPPIDISSTVNPPLPLDGPVTLDFSQNIPELGPGAHEICLTATGRDIGGEGSITTCGHVVEGAGALTYNWQLVSAVGPPVQLSSTTSPQPTFLAIDDGSYIFKLTVTDGFGATANDQVTIRVTNVAPAISASSREAFSGGVTLVTASFTDQGWLDTHKATFDWGDGSTAETVPVNAQGAGWGSFFGSHIYKSGGSYQVKVTTQDDDGGISSSTISVKVASAVTLWANSRNATKTLDWGGGPGAIEGLVHSNNNILVRGEPKSINGPTEYVSSFQTEVGGGPYTFNPAPVKVLPSDFPLRFNLNDYRPGGVVSLQVGKDYHNRSANCDKKTGKWHVNKEVLPSGVYYVNCKVELNGSNIGGRITLAAQGSIIVSGSLPAFEPFYDGLLFLGGDKGDKAINISASNSKFLGFVFSELGQIDVSGSDNRFFCGLLADRISLTGSRLSLRGGDCGRPSSTVAIPLLVPKLALSLEADKNTALPANTINYTLNVGNAGSVLVVPGVVGLENVDSASATVKSYAYVLEYFSIANQAWVPLASAAAAAPGYTPIQPLPTIGGAQLSIRSNPFVGVTYPTTGDLILNTVLQPRGFATWGYQALVNLTPDQVKLLLDPARVGGFRNRVEFELDPPNVQIRRLFRFGSDFVNQLRALSGDIFNAEIIFSPPAGDPRFISSTSVAGLATLAPGDSVVTGQAYQIPAIESRRVGETEDGYRARLLAFNGAKLFGSAYARATGGVGLLVAPQIIHATTEQVPILTVAKTGPATANAGELIRWNVRLGNIGSANAQSIVVTDTMDNAPLTVVSAPSTLAPTQVANATAAFAISLDQPGGEIVNIAAVSWSDMAGNAYGPANSTAITTVLTAPALNATLVDSLFADNDNNGLISSGDVIRYEAQVNYTGGNALTGVHFHATVDSLTTVVPGTVTTTSGTVTSGNNSGDTTVHIDAGTLGGQSEFTIFWQVTIANLLPEGINTASTQGEVASNELPPVLTDDPAVLGTADPTVTVVVVPTPVIGLTLAGQLASDADGDGAISAGDTVRYTARLMNTGGVAATGVQAMFPPDENTSLVVGSVTTSLGSVLTGNNTGDTFVQVDIGEFPISADITINFNVTIKKPFPSGTSTIEVQGWVTSNELDPVLSDDPTTATEADATSLLVASGGGSGPAPSIGEISPEDGTIATEPIAISTQLTPPDGESIARWRVIYRQSNSDLEVEFGSGTGTAVNATLDPTLLVNGTYILTIEAEASGGGVSVKETSVIVDGQLKPGRFVITFQDLDINVGGLPLQVLRKYDSYEKSVGDFGVGWTSDIADFRVGTNKPLGQGGWRQEPAGCGLVFCTLHYVSDTQHFVTVTWPDGTDEIFDLTPTDGSTFFPPATSAAFTARPDATSKLEALDTSLFFTGDGNLYGGGFGSGSIYDPQQFRLTDRFGNKYILDRVDGLLSLTDLSGNTLTFNSNGISSSRGPSLEFTRDAEGRITQITDPNAKVHAYDYDANGNLRAHTDPEGNTTQFFYDSNHLLLEVRDPRGIQPIRSEYDDSGRLIAHIDADGNRIEYAHDIGARQQIIRDRLGRITILEYDTEGNLIRTTDPLGHSTSFTYDDRGNQLSETDALGHTTSFTYDNQNNLLTRTDKLGKMTSFTYGGSSRLLTMTNPIASTITFTYDANGNPITVTDPLGNTVTQTYDAQGNVVSTTDSLGNTDFHEYDPIGKLINTINPLGHSTTFTYDENGNQLTLTTTRRDELGNSVNVTTTNVYDENGRLIQTIDPEGNSAFFEYNAVGQLTASIDKNGNRTEFEYDLLGNLIQTTFPDNAMETATYDAESNQISFTDKAGRTTHFSYDSNDRLVETGYPDGSVRTVEYDAAGRMIATTDENGNRTRFEHDAEDRLTKLTDSLGNITNFAYDSKGNLIQETNPNSHMTTFAYDALNRLTKTTFADGTFFTTVYDGLGRAIAETDPIGNTTQFEYDRLGRLAKVIDALGNETAYAYDEASNLIAETDARGNTTRWAYDNLGRKIKQTLPLGMNETLTYDPNGNVLTRTDFNGQTTTFTYDVNDRLLEKSYPDATGMTITYTETGQRETVTDSAGVTSYSYDQRDYLIKVVNPDGSTLEYTYDPVGNRTSLEVPSGTTTYAYDARNQLSTVTDPGGGITSYAYDPVGNLTNIGYPNGTTAVYTYDSLNRLLSLQNRNSSGDPIAGFTYALDAVGNRLSVVDQDGGRFDYAYDNLYRLVQEQLSDLVLGNLTTSYSYDAVGNRLTKTDAGGTTTYSYDANNRLLTDGNFTYTHDSNGNTLTKTDGAGLTQYGYDFEDRLISVQTPADNINFGYNADGIRILSTVNGVVTRYLVDGNQKLSQVVEERAGDGSLIASYTYGKDLLSQKHGTGTSYYHYDGLGSTRALTDSNENISDRYTYSAFGTLLGSSGTMVNNYLFAGEQFDPNLSAYYLRARYYYPGLGRFLTRDMVYFPLEDPVEHNLYSYARNNPVNFTDPSGNTTLVEGRIIQTSIVPFLIASTPAVVCGIQCTLTFIASYLGSDLSLFPGTTCACRAGRWKSFASCPVQTIGAPGGGIQIVGTLEGQGTGHSKTEAENAARTDANSKIHREFGPGHKLKHCTYRTYRC